MKLIVLVDWLNLIASYEKAYREQNTTVYVCGEGDSTYFVIETEATDPAGTLTQYTIHSNYRKNPLLGALQFIEDNGPDLKTLVKTITRAEYISQGIHDVAAFDDIEISRYTLEDNKKIFYFMLESGG